VSSSTHLSFCNTGQKRGFGETQGKGEIKTADRRGNKKSHLKNSIKNTIIVEVKFFLDREFVPEYTDSSAPFNSTY
jgi:hypothetical protein